RPATVDAEGLDTAVRRVDPLAEEEAGEADLAALARPHADDDLVKSFASAFLDVDVASKGGRDRGREVVAGQLLRALVDGKVSVRDVDGLVRHHDIVTPILRVSIRTSIRIVAW